MGQYRFQAKATEDLGCEFRSKLEAQWAYYFTSRGLDWCYADKDYYDFEVNGIKIEIKPYAEGMLWSAAKRIPLDQTVVVCVFGHPPDISHADRFKSSKNLCSVKAFSVWSAVFSKPEDLAFNFRTAHVGLWLEDDFFSHGCVPNKAVGLIDDGGHIIPFPAWHMTCSEMIRGLISKEQKQVLADRIESSALRMTAPLK